MNEGIVYVLTNHAMPGMVKIGKTGREVETRLRDLYTTGVPLPFECAYAASQFSVKMLSTLLYCLCPLRKNSNAWSC